MQEEWEDGSSPRIHESVYPSFDESVIVRDPGNEALARSIRKSVFTPEKFLLSISDSFSFRRIIPDSSKLV